MRRLDRLHLEYPFAGSRRLRGLLVAEGCKIGRRHVNTLMRRIGMRRFIARPRTARREPGHKVYPYLLRGMAITRRLERGREAIERTLGSATTARTCARLNQRAWNLGARFFNRQICVSEG